MEGNFNCSWLFGRLLSHKKTISLILLILLILSSFLLIITSFSYNVDFNEQRAIEFITNIHANTPIQPETLYFPTFPVYYLNYPFLFFAIIAFILSITCLLCNILFLLHKFTRYPLVGIILISLILICNLCENYFWIATNGSQHIIDQCLWSYGNVNFQDGPLAFSMTSHFYTPGSVYHLGPTSFAGTLFSSLSLLISIIQWILHYLFSSDLDGETASETINTWITTIVGKTKHGYQFVHSTLRGNKVIKVRQSGSRYYKEIELEELTYSHLISKISSKFNISGIQEILKGSEVIINDDDDVSRLKFNEEVEFITDQPSPNILSNDDDRNVINIEFTHQ